MNIFPFPADTNSVRLSRTGRRECEAISIIQRQRAFEGGTAAAPEIEQTRDAMDAARSRFEQAVDPLLIDCFIYELNAAQLKYQFLLRNFKKVRASAAGGHSQHSASRRKRP